MPTMLDSFGELVQSVFDFVGAIVQTILNLFRSVMQGAFNILHGIISTVFDVVRGSLNALGGLAKFLIGNFFVIAVIAAGVYGFLVYQRKQGRTVKIGDKKLN